MTEIKFLKVIDVLPDRPKRDSVYFVYLTATHLVNIYVTDAGGNARAVGQAVNDSDVLSVITTKFVFDETPNGVLNGSNNTFTSVFNFIPGFVDLFINGLKQKHIQDYITVGNNTVTPFIAPLSTDSITLNYIKL